MYRVVERLERARVLVQSRLSHRNLRIFLLLHLLTSSILFVLSLLSIDANAHACYFLRHLVDVANLTSVMFVNEDGEVGNWRLAPARILGEASEHGEVVCNDDGRKCKLAGRKSGKATKGSHDSNSTSSSASAASASSTLLIEVDDVITSATANSTAASTSPAINLASAVSSLVSMTTAPSTTIIPPSSIPISHSITLATPTNTPATTSFLSASSSPANLGDTSADSASSATDAHGEESSDDSPDEETPGAVALVLAKATRVPLVPREVGRAHPTSLAERTSAAVRSARSARSAIAKRQIELALNDSGDESDDSVASIDSLTARVSMRSIKHRAADLVAPPLGERQIKRASTAHSVRRGVKARQAESGLSESGSDSAASVTSGSTDSADSGVDSNSEDASVTNVAIATTTSGAVGDILSVPGLTSSVTSISDKVSSSAKDSGEEIGDERRSMGKFVKRSIEISQLEKQGMVLGVHVVRLAVDSDVFVSQDCAINFGWSINSLDNVVREDIVLAAFFLWILGLAIVAILNESIPHLLALLISLILSTVWTANDLRVSYQFWNNFSTMMKSHCAGANILPDYLAMRVGFQGTMLGINVATLGASGWLCWRLKEHFGWQTFQRIGASSGINKIYRVVLALSIVLQLDAFVLVTFFALFLDQISRGPVGYYMTKCKAWQAIYSLLIIMLFPWTCLGWTSIRREQRKRFNAFLGLSALLISGWAASFSNTVFRVVFTTWSFFTAIGTLALALTLLSIGLAIYRRTTFDKGLAEFLYVEEIHERPTVGFDEKPGAVLEPAGRGTGAAVVVGGDGVEVETMVGGKRSVLPTFSTAFGPGPAPPPYDKSNDKDSQRKMFPAPPVSQLQVPERARSRVPSWQAGDDRRPL